jgi:hypothetical protein
VYPEGTRNLGYLGIDGKIILKWTFEKQVVKMLTRLYCIWIGSNCGVSWKYQRFKEVPIPWAYELISAITV